MKQTAIFEPVSVNNIFFKYCLNSYQSLKTFQQFIAYDDVLIKTEIVKYIVIKIHKIMNVIYNKTYLLFFLDTADSTYLTRALRPVSNPFIILA